MIAYICDHCKKMIENSDENAAHLKITFGQRGITSQGQYGNTVTTTCLCIYCYAFPDNPKSLEPAKAQFVPKEGEK